MTPTIAAVFAFALGLPVVVFIAAASVAGINPEFLTGALTFTVVVGGVVAMLFEINRYLGP